MTIARLLSAGQQKQVLAVPHLLAVELRDQSQDTKDPLDQT
jgi:hypothetical protein